MHSVSKEIELTLLQLRQMQLIQLEMLVEVDRICRKNEIKYSLDGGTLLGAVRHKGFIPWDDDIDVIMVRNEYERFFKACKNDLDSERFFLQDYRTDPNYRLGYARIRRNGTVYLRSGHEHMNYRTGVFIDIFILDNVPDSAILRILHCFSCYCIRRILWSEAGKVSHSSFLGRKWFGLLSLIPRNFVFSMLNRLNMLNNHKRTELVRHTTFPYPRNCMFGVKRQYFEEFTELTFEGYTFLASKQYNKYLTDLYGNYMILPPFEKRTGHKNIAAFVPIKPLLKNEDLIASCFQSDDDKQEDILNDQ